MMRSRSQDNARRNLLFVFVFLTYLHQAARGAVAAPCFRILGDIPGMRRESRDRRTATGPRPQARPRAPVFAGHRLTPTTVGQRKGCRDQLPSNESLAPSPLSSPNPRRAITAGTLRVTAPPPGCPGGVKVIGAWIKGKSTPSISGADAAPRPLRPQKEDEGELAERWGPRVLLAFQWEARQHLPRAKLIIVQPALPLTTPRPGNRRRVPPSLLRADDQSAAGRLPMPALRRIRLDAGTSIALLSCIGDVLMGVPRGAWGFLGPLNEWCIRSSLRVSRAVALLQPNTAPRMVVVVNGGGGWMDG